MGQGVLASDWMGAHVYTYTCAAQMGRLTIAHRRG